MAAVVLGGRPGAAFADAPQVTAYNVDQPAHLTVGDHINVSITVEADKGSRVQIAPGGIPPELAQAQSPRFTTKTLDSGRTQVTIDLVLAAFVVGDYAMPPLTLRVQDAGGNVSQLQTPAAHLVIESTIPANASGEPRPLKPQAEAGSAAPPPYLLLAGAGALAAVAIAVMYVAWRRLTGPEDEGLAPAAPQEVLGPEDAARRTLDEVGAHFAAGHGFAAYYAGLSGTVREYLTRRFGFPAFALTTAELQGQMVFRGMDRWQARLVGGLLDQCDAVMFTRTTARRRSAPMPTSRQRTRSSR